MDQLSLLPEPNSAASPPETLADASITRIIARRGKIIAFLRSRSELGAAGTLVDLRLALRHSNVTLARDLAALEREGRIVHTGRRRGWVVPGVLRSGVTLQRVLDQAASCVEAAHVAASGPRTRGKSAADRRIERLSPSQYAKARTAAAIAAEACSPEHDPKATGSVGVQALEWDPDAGTWALVDRVRTWSRQHRMASPAATAAHVEGITVLLDLAATHGWIGRQPVHAGAFTTHAAEWELWIDTILPDVGAAALSPSAVARLVAGLRGLAQVATLLSMSPTGAIDWPRVAAALVAERSSTEPCLSREALRLSVSAYNRLLDHGLAPGDLIGGRRAGRTRDGLVSMNAIRAAVERGDWSGWCDGHGRRYAALLDGPYGLPRFIEWLDARVPPSVLAERGLPARMPSDRSDSSAMRRAIRKRKAGHPWFERRVSSLIQRLKQINVAAGVAARVLGVDWTCVSLDARRLADVHLVRRYARDWATELRAVDGHAYSVQVARVVEALAHLAAPFASGVAHILNDRDAERTMLDAHATLAPLVEEHLPPPDHGAALERKVAHWTEGDPERADQRLAALETQLRARVIRKAGGMSISAQIDAVRGGTLSVRDAFAWRCAVRDAAAFITWRRIPMRGHNLGALVLGEEWHAYGSRPWEGAIRVSVTGHGRMKTSEPLQAWLIKHAGDEDAERLLPRDMLELYLMPSGAREQLLCDGGTQHTSRYVFVSDSRTCGRAAAREGRIERGLPWTSCSAAFERWIHREGAHIGVDAARAPRGATRGHILRHLGATIWESRGLPEYARALLGHARPRDTAGAHYVSREAHALAPEEALARATRGLPPRASGEESSRTAPIPSITSDPEPIAACIYCFEPLRLREGRVAQKCAACGEWQHDSDAGRHST